MTTIKMLFCRKLAISHNVSQAMDNAIPGSSRNASGYYSFYVRDTLLGEGELRYPEFSGSEVISSETGLRYSFEKGMEKISLWVSIAYWILMMIYSLHPYFGAWFLNLLPPGHFILGIEILLCHTMCPVRRNRNSH